MKPGQTPGPGIVRELLENLNERQAASRRSMYAAAALAHPYTHVASPRDAIRKAFEAADEMIAYENGEWT